MLQPAWGPKPPFTHMPRDAPAPRFGGPTASSSATSTASDSAAKTPSCAPWSLNAEPSSQSPTPRVEGEWPRQAQLGPAEHGLRPEYRCPGQGSPLFTPVERVRERPAWTLPAPGRRLVVVHL